MSSLRRQLLLPLLLVPLMCGIPGAYWIYHNIQREIGESFDYQLIAITRALQGQSIDQIKSQKTSDPEDDDVCIQLWDADGRLVYHSDEEIAPRPLGGDGLLTLDGAGGPWRSYARPADGFELQVAQPLEARQTMAAAAAARVLWPLLVLLGAWACLAWLVITRGLAPLAQLAVRLSQRAPLSLEPLHIDNAPAEVQPMAAALNDLLLRLSAAFATQRNFVADAAHALRTPLASLQIQAETARGAPGALDRAQALDALVAGIARTSRLVQQLLALARLEPGVVGRDSVHQIDLDALARETVAAASLLARSRRIDLGLTQAEPAPLKADVFGLRSLLDNLVDNAVRYTQEGGRIDVSVLREDHGVCVKVSDNGPGIAAEEQARVFDRFYRAAGATGSGSGLGLAIAAEIAQSHDGWVKLSPGLARDDGGHGLCVTVHLRSLRVLPS